MCNNQMSGMPRICVKDDRRVRFSISRVSYAIGGDVAYQDAPPPPPIRASTPRPPPPPVCLTDARSDLTRLHLSPFKKSGERGAGGEGNHT